MTGLKTKRKGALMRPFFIGLYQWPCEWTFPLGKAFSGPFPRNAPYCALLGGACAPNQRLTHVEGGVTVTGRWS